MSTATREKCKNNPEFSYSGKEMSPLGLGFCADAEDTGTVMEGKDKTKWMIGIKNGVKVWNRIPTSSAEASPSTPMNLKKDKPVVKKSDDKMDSEEEEESTDKKSEDEDEDDEEEIVKEVKKLTVKEKKPATKKKAVETPSPKPKTKKTTKKEDEEVASTTSSKTKRPPNDFNIYMKYRLHVLKNEEPDMAHKERFSKAASEWKTLSDKVKKDTMILAKEYYQENQ